MRDPNLLVSTDQLATMLVDPALRLFDCTTHLNPPPPGSDGPYTAVPGFETFAAGHIPGANFLDLQGEFSDQTTKLRFMMADVAQVGGAFGRHGVGPGTKVVLYNLGPMVMWATRAWWMLRSLGFDAAVLDGGFDKWKAEGRPIATGPGKPYAPANFVAKPRAGMFVGRDDILAAIDKPGTVIVNALNNDLHKGVGPSRYGRPGRIPSSVNVSAATLLKPADKTFTDLADAEAKFQAAGVTKDKHVIAYCGGGISATVDLFLLHQLGYDDITLYDASMGEWAKDTALPIATGD
jgi:thiosulfate/3-mercaptopyruvate sulfurtransferase